jgi:MYXO-CTERM domain-containing protein
VKDGDEDTNHNGVVDPGETDPNNPKDDRVADGGAGGSGGSTGIGEAGATAASGNGGTAGSIGVGDGGPDGGGTVGFDGGMTAGAAGTAGANNGVLEGGGCACSTSPGNTGAFGGLALGVAALGLWSARRRRKTR